MSQMAAARRRKARPMRSMERRRPGASNLARAPVPGFAGRMERRYSTSSSASGPSAFMPLFTFLCWSSLYQPISVVDRPGGVGDAGMVVEHPLPARRPLLPPVAMFAARGDDLIRREEECGDGCGVAAGDGVIDLRARGADGLGVGHRMMIDRLRHHYGFVICTVVEPVTFPPFADATIVTGPS